VNDLRFSHTQEPTHDYGLPWEVERSHGIVTTDPTTPGALHLGAGYWYDVDASRARAEHQKWKLPPGMEGRDPVALDVLYLRGWCREEWHYTTVTLTLLNIDGDPTPEHVTERGVASSLPLGPVLDALRSQLNKRVGKVLTIARGAVTHQIRPKVERPWNPEVYSPLRATLIERGMKTTKAHNVALKYARRKGTPKQLLTTFHREYPVGRVDPLTRTE